MRRRTVSAPIPGSRGGTRGVPGRPGPVGLACLAGMRRAADLSPGDVVELDLAGGDTVTGYVVDVAGGIAIQPLRDGVRAGLDGGAVWVEPDQEVRLTQAAENRHIKVES